MGVLSWFGIDESRTTPVSMPVEEHTHAQDEFEVLRESIADLELAMEDQGWARLTGEGEHEFSREGLGKIAAVCRTMAISNPLIKRGLNIRQAYVFGQGVQVQARATGEEPGQQDANDVVQAFWTDEGNRAGRPDRRPGPGAARTRSGHRRQRVPGLLHRPTHRAGAGPHRAVRRGRRGHHQPTLRTAPSRGSTSGSGRPVA